VASPKSHLSRCHLKSCAVYIGPDPTTSFFFSICIVLLCDVDLNIVNYDLNEKQHGGNFLHELSDSLEMY